MDIHTLKTWPDYFQAVWDGRKQFEARKHDRDYKVWDAFVLKEFNPARGTYSGRTINAKITYMMKGGQFGVEVGHCILSLEVESKFSITET